MENKTSQDMFLAMRHVLKGMPEEAQQMYSNLPADWNDLSQEQRRCFEDMARNYNSVIEGTSSIRYYLAPDTIYNSNLYHVFDSQVKNKFGEQACVLSFVPLITAQQECDRLNKEK